MIATRGRSKWPSRRSPKPNPDPDTRLARPARQRTSSGILDHVLDAIHRLAALCGPAFLVILHKLDVGEFRHLARQVGQIEILAGRPAERLLEDHLTNVLAVDVVDELARTGRVRTVLDDGDAF